MAIKGSKPYEIDGDKYSFAFDNSKLVGVNKVDPSGDVQSNADLNAAIFQTDAVKANIIEAHNISKHGGNTDNYLSTDADKISESFSSIEQATDSEKISYSNFQKKEI